MNSSGRVFMRVRVFSGSMLISLYANVPSAGASSIITTLPVFEAVFLTRFSSSGFMNLRFTTSAFIPFSASSVLTSSAVDTIFPLAIMEISLPASTTIPFPLATGVSLLFTVTDEDPLGYLIDIGALCSFTANSSMFSNSR